MIWLVRSLRGLAREFRTSRGLVSSGLPPPRVEFRTSAGGLVSCSGRAEGSVSSGRVGEFRTSRGLVSSGRAEQRS